MSDSRYGATASSPPQTTTPSQDVAAPDAPPPTTGPVPMQSDERSAGPATEPATGRTAETRVEPSDDAGPEELEKHIEQTREELGQTVEALIAKFDVKSQVRETQDRLRGVWSHHGRTIAAGGASVIAAVVGFIVWRRRNR